MYFDLDHLFTYHPLRPGQGEKYSTIRSAAATVELLILDLSKLDGTGKAGWEQQNAQGWHDSISQTCKAFAQAIVDTCPSSADVSAAIRCVRLIRNACNHFVATRARGEHYFPTPALELSIAHQELLKATWQANGAIALQRD